MKYLFFILFFFVFQDTYYLKAQKNGEYKFTYLYSDALKFKLDNNPDAALDLFQQCLKYKPNSSASLYQISLIYAQKKQYNDAIVYIDRALAIVPNNEWFLLLKAELSAQVDDDKSFVQTYKLLYKYFPDNPEYAYKLAVIYYKQGKYDEALRILNLIENEQGVVENISFLKNNIYYQTKRYDLLLLELKKLVSIFPDSVKYVDMLAKYYLSMRQVNEAIDVYQTGLVHFPENKRLSIGYAKLYADMKNFSEGYPLLIQGIGALNVDNKTIAEIAQSYLNSHEISNDKKIQIYTLLINNYPDELSFQTEFINYLLHQNKYSLAETRIKLILNLHPDNFDLWKALFEIYAQQKKFQLLHESADKALEYFPNQALVYYYSGFADFFMAQYAQSIQTFLSGLDYIVDNKDLSLQFYFFLAEGYLRLNDLSNSDKYFEKYLSLDFQDPIVLNHYAKSLAQDGRNLDKALNLALKSIEIQPFNAQFLDTYAWVFYLKKQYKEALFNIEKAYKYGGYDDALICEHYAYILLMNKQPTKAKELIHHALKLNPNNRSLKELLDRLD